MATRGENLGRSIISLIVKAGYHCKPDYVVVPPKPIWDEYARRYKTKCVLDGLVFDPQNIARQRLFEVTTTCSWNTHHKRAQKDILVAVGLLDQVLLLGRSGREILETLRYPDLMRAYLRPKIGW